MSHIMRYLHNFARAKSRNSYTVLTNKVYYCERKITFETIEKIIKDEQTVPLQDASKPRSCQEIETITFANDQEILQTVITEKEKDANVRSRLSKECNKLHDKRIKLTSSGLNLHLENKTAQDISWEKYPFDKTIVQFKKYTPKSTVEPRGTYQASAGGGSGTIAAEPSNRIVRQRPGKVLFAFIPEEWFHFFIPKTGVTGFGTFLFTFSTFLISKEYYVLEHNFYNGLGMLCVCWGAITYVGPHLAKFLDQQIRDYEKGWQHGRDTFIEVLNEQIADEYLMQYQTDGQLMLIEAKRENVHLQLEDEFRKRQMMVYKTVLKRLDYHVAIGAVYKRIFHKNLVQYVTGEVRKAITPDMESKMLSFSIENLLHELEKGDTNKS